MIPECFYFKNGIVIRKVCKGKWKSTYQTYQVYRIITALDLMQKCNLIFIPTGESHSGSPGNDSIHVSHMPCRSVAE